MPLRAWILLGCLALIWGGSFPSNRLALAEFGVFATVAFRLGFGALAIWAYVLWRGVAMPRAPRIWAAFAVMAVLNNVLPFSLIVWGQTHVPSGLAAILNAATAFFGTGIAALVFREERLGPRRAAGVSLGFLGVAIAIGIGALADFSLRSAGQIAILGASLSYGISGAFARAALRGVAPDAVAAGVLSMAALMALPLMLAVEGMPSLAVSTQTWGALLYLGLVASAGAYMLFYRVLALAGPANLSLVTLLVAPVAIVLGAVMFGEALPLRAYLGFAILAAGLVTIDGRLPRHLAGRAAQKPRDPAPPLR